MQRIAEPELMDDTAQARAYAEADFEQPHGAFIEHCRALFGTNISGPVLDLGCGPADISVRFARAYPHCVIDGIDGAAAMLELGKQAVHAARLDDRIRLRLARLPQARLPRAHYRMLLSNSLLHHLADPLVLWRSISHAATPGAAVFIMDLMRPHSRAEAESLTAQYTGGEAEILRHDFFHSLLAAYRVDEVRAQLRTMGLHALCVESVSDRHLIVHGHV